MQRSVKKSLFNSLWLSLLLHLLILLCFTMAITYERDERKSPHIQEVRSYLYTGKITPSVQQFSQPKSVSASSTANAPAAQNASAPIKAPPVETAPFTESAQLAPKSVPAPKSTPNLKSIMSSSLAVLDADQRKAIHAFKESEPIYLIGDEHTYADPLIKLMGRALSAHFEYPKMAGELGITGRVIIGLVLHPEGKFTDIKILKSSNNHDLDAAALYAVNSAPTVMGADRFLTTPKFFVVGFIFNYESR